MSARAGRYGFGYPGSVNHNGTHFLMHYIAGPARREGIGKAATSFGAIAVAVSVDGLHWTHKRPLRFFTPLNSNGGEHCVLHDVHEADPKLRWKMVHNCNAPQVLVLGEGART